MYLIKKKRVCQFFLLGISGLILADDLRSQSVKNPYAATDKIALALPDSLSRNTADIAAYYDSTFQSKPEKVRATFAWLSTRIAYDVSKMYIVEFHEPGEDLCTNTLLSRKGICENYAAIFQEVCSKMGVETYIVDGYNRYNGRTEYIPHAWCIALVDTVWQFYDPTWAAGYVNNNTFYPKRSDAYFQPEASEFIQTHMPFDPMWQMQSATFTYPAFDSGAKVAALNGKFFAFRDSIDQYLLLDEEGKMQATLRRMEANGQPNSLVYNRMVQYKAYLQNAEQNRIANTYNAASAKHNAAVMAYNLYIEAKNRQFYSLDDTQVQRSLGAAAIHLAESRADLSEIGNTDKQTKVLIDQLNQATKDLEGQLAREQYWLDTYIAKNGVGRRAMFYR